jgi:hypothetical protein
MKPKRLRCEALEPRDLLSTVTITGLHHEQISIKNPGNGTVIDLSGGEFPALEDTHFPIGEPLPASWPTGHSEWISGNAEAYPIKIYGTSSNIVVNGGRIYGVMDERAPWETWKYYSDGTGLRIEGSGTYEIRNTLIQNVEDAIRPRGPAGAQFNIHDVFLDRIKDDMIENIDYHSGTISNSYLRGFVLLSTQHGNLSAPPSTTVIKNSVVELLPEVYKGKLGTGAMFKWDYNSAGKSAGTAKVDVRDSVFLINMRSSVSTKIMQFAPGTYSNVTVVYLGVGAYPWPAPPGVTITRDRTVYDNAVKAFFASHPQFASVAPSGMNGLAFALAMDQLEADGVTRKVKR